MGVNLFKWSCYLTAGFVFVWVFIVWSHYSYWLSTVGFVWVGIFFYVSTFLKLGKGLTWTARICACLWSIAVFLLFAGHAQMALSTTPSMFHGVPVWMQVSSPFVYAAVPLIILWGTRMATVYLDK